MVSKLCGSMFNQTKSIIMNTENKSQSAPKDGVMLDVTLAQWLREQGCVKATKLTGPNGAFISWNHKDGSRNTLPVGSNSQDGKLADFGLIQTADGVLIATVNNYEVDDTMEFN